MNVRYENYCSVATPRGIGKVVDIDYMSMIMAKLVFTLNSRFTLSCHPKFWIETASYWQVKA